MRKSKIAISFLGFLLPFFASAHEVYVLNNSEITKDLVSPPLNLFAVALSHHYQFLTAGFFGILIIGCVFGISIMHNLGKHVGPFLIKIKPYAAHLAQLTLGFAVVASAYYGALFGTELPLAQLFGGYAHLVTILLYISGVSIIFGIYPRLGGFITMTLYIWSIFTGQGTYMLSYVMYFGEALVIFLFGGGYALLRYKPTVTLYGIFNKFFIALKKRKHFIIRICFSTSIIYAALYAKLIHGELALNTVIKYNLTHYFPFDPLFIVLGAFLIEMFIGIFFLIGFEIRFTALFFLTFLTMSLFFFGESIWPHVVLIGTAITLFVHGYDEFTVEKLWYKEGKQEPVL